MRNVAAPNGYTLVEMLAAMLVLGLAMTALTQATRLFARTAHHAAAVSSGAARAMAVERLMRRALGAGPYGSAQTGAEAALQGDRRRLAFDCGEATDCELLIQDRDGTILTALGRVTRSLPVNGRDLKFQYVVAGQMADRFPAADNDRPLEAIAITNSDGAVVASWRPQASQSADCAFDQVNHRCFAKRSGAAND